jgi:hypothetical protein
MLYAQDIDDAEQPAIVTEAKQEETKREEAPRPPTDPFKAGGESAAATGGACVADAECASGNTCFEFRCTESKLVAAIRHERSISARDDNVIGFGPFFSYAAPITGFSYTPEGGTERKIARAPRAVGIEGGAVGGAGVAVGYSSIEPEPGVRIDAFHVRFRLGFPITVYRTGIANLTRVFVSPGIDVLGVDAGVGRGDVFVSTAARVEGTLLWRRVYVTLAPANFEFFFLYNPSAEARGKTNDTRGTFGLGVNYVFRLSAGIAF